MNYFLKKCYEYWAPTQTRFILHELISQILLFCNYENSFLLIWNQEKQKIIWKSKKICELKIFKKNWVELKLFERKLEFWNLFENWSLENYSKIRVLKIKFKNLEFWKLNLKEIGNLKIIWEFGVFLKFNYENCDFRN